MKKWIVCFAGIAFLSGCASHKSAYRYSADNAHDPQQRIFAVDTVKVRLDQVKAVEGFPGEDEMAAIFRNKIEEGLASGNQLATSETVGALKVSYDIQYKRVFAGEFFGVVGSVGRPFVTISSDIRREGEVIASYRLDRVTTNHGAAGNFLTIGKQLTQTTGPDEEMKDISIIAGSMVEHLVNLGE